MGKRKILVGGCEGIWDRLRTITIAVAFGELTGRDVHVAWRDESYSETGEDVFFRYFEPDPLKPWPEEPLEGVFPPIWAGYTSLTFEQMKMRVESSGGRQLDLKMDLSKYEGHDPIVVLYQRPTGLRSLMKQLGALAEVAGKQSAEQDAVRTRPSIENRDFQGLVSEVAADCLRLRPDIQAEIDSFRTEHFAGPTIGLHIRYTDRMADLSRALRSLEQVLESDTDAQVFLATDSAAIRDMIGHRYGNVVTQGLALSSDNTPLHKGEAPVPDRFEVGRGALVDLYLLGACDYLLYCDRGFAAFAAAISEQPRQYQIAYHGGREVLVREPNQGGGVSAPTVSILVPTDGTVPESCLREMNSQRYPAAEVEVLATGKRVPAEVLDEVEGKIIVVADASRSHGPGWLEGLVRQLLARPLCGLLYDSLDEAGHPREVAFLRSLLHDPGLGHLTADLSPASEWGMRVTALGYKHKSLSGGAEE